MPPTSYVERPPRVEAEQFDAKKVPPYPAGMDDCGRLPAAHVHLVLGLPDAPLLIPVHDTDWIVTDAAGSVTVLTDAAFTATYTKPTGP